MLQHLTTTTAPDAKDEARRLMADLELAQRRDPLVAGAGDAPAMRRSWRRPFRRAMAPRR
jgi:hypothetical protein